MRTIDKTEQIKYRASKKEVSELAKVSKETGISKSEILRIGVRTIANNLKGLHSDIKKKVTEAKREGKPISYRELFQEPKEIEKELNNAVFNEITDKKQKK